MVHRAKRKIEGLIWADPCSKPPPVLERRAKATRAKVEGAAKDGYRFEAKVGRELAARGAMPRAGQWFEFRDANGVGWCETDFLIHQGSHIIVVECKLRQHPLNIHDLTDLYLPVVQEAYGLPVYGVLACKMLFDGTEWAGKLTRPEEFLATPQIGVNTWLVV